MLVVSQYFWPEDFRINELTSEMTRRGHEVTVLTGEPNYPGGRVFPSYVADPARYRRFGSVNVVRVPIVTRGRSRLRLVLSYLSFVVAATLIGAIRLRGARFDAVFAFQPSPVTVGVPAVILGRLKRAPVVLWVLDQWPETLVAVGVVRSRLAIRVLGRLVAFIYRRCELVLAQSKGMVPLVRGYCPDDVEVGYFPNWVEGMYSQRAEGEGPEGRASDREGPFTVLFAGNIGEAQDFPAIVEAADQLRSRENIRWLIVGDGRMRAWLETEIERRGLEARFTLPGRFPADRMAPILRDADALLVSLKRDPLFAMTVPGKLQTYLAAGRPVIGMLDGEGAEIIREAGAGFSCSAADSESLARIVLEMSLLPATEREAMGRRGMEYSRREFDRDVLMDRLEGWLSEVQLRA